MLPAQRCEIVEVFHPSPFLTQTCMPYRILGPRCNAPLSPPLPVDTVLISPYGCSSSDPRLASSVQYSVRGPDGADDITLCRVSTADASCLMSLTLRVL